MRNVKRIMAILLSVAMVMGSSVAVMAETPDPEGSIGTKESELEGYVNKKVFTYQVPTASNDALKMIFDPQELIKDTEAAAYAGVTKDDFEAGKTVYFHRSDANATNKYMGTSDSLSVCNLGTVSMNVSFTSEVKSFTGIEFASSNAAYTAAKTPAVNLTMNVTAKPSDEKTLTTSSKIPVSTNGEVTKGEMTVSSGVVDGVKLLYKASYNGIEDGKKNYTYEIPSANAAAALTAAIGDEFAFQYEAAANDVEGWASVTAKPVLSLTYKFEKRADGSAVNCTGVYDSSTKKFKITWPSGVTCTDTSKITNTKVNGKAFETTIGASADGTKISFGKDEVKEACGGSTPATCIFTFTYNGVDYTSTITVS